MRRRLDIGAVAVSISKGLQDHRLSIPFLSGSAHLRAAGDRNALGPEHGRRPAEEQEAEDAHGVRESDVLVAVDVAEGEVALPRTRGRAAAAEELRLGSDPGGCGHEACIMSVGAKSLATDAIQFVMKLT